MSAHIEFDLPDWEAERLRQVAQANGVPLEVEIRHAVDWFLGSHDFEPGLPDPENLL